MLCDIVSSHTTVRSKGPRTQQGVAAKYVTMGSTHNRKPGSYQQPTVAGRKSHHMKELLLFSKKKKMPLVQQVSTTVDKRGSHHTFIMRWARASFSFLAGSCTKAMKDVAPDSLAIIFAHRKKPVHSPSDVHTLAPFSRVGGHEERRTYNKWDQT